MESPFQFGKLATRDNFVDRVTDRAELKQMLGSGINVALISPRRWGKSSLVSMAMEELCRERDDVRVCHIDAFSISSEEEFYNVFAAKIISCASTKIEKALADGRKYLSRMIPGITLTDGLNDVLSVNLKYTPGELDKEEVLNLPERIAADKGIRIIVCIDEFQQLAEIPEYSAMEGKMRSVWQKQSNVSYCFYGSKKHMMLNIFGDSQKPFYRFAQIIFMPKIKKEDWVPFIVGGFESSGKSISVEYAEKICDTVECHSWYLQQFCFLLWSATEEKVDERLFTDCIQRIIDTNAPMFMSDIEALAPSQRVMLKAIAHGEKMLFSEGVQQKYHLGNPNTIARNKKALSQKPYMDVEGESLVISDPVFLMWYKTRF